jgi:hypothetical protein
MACPDSDEGRYPLNAEAPGDLRIFIDIDLDQDAQNSTSTGPGYSDLLPLDAAYRATVDGELNLLFRRAGGVIDLGHVFLAHPEYLRCCLNTKGTAYTDFLINPGDPGHWDTPSMWGVGDTTPSHPYFIKGHFSVFFPPGKHLFHCRRRDLRKLLPLMVKKCTLSTRRGQS